MGFYDKKDEWTDSILRMKTWMTEEGVTQAELSRRTGISQSQLSKVLNGKFEFISPLFWKRLSKLDNYSWIKFGLN